ncbi:MAG: hypothetical protein R3F59_09985 [Myxococcota bacterium]
MAAPVVTATEVRDGYRELRVTYPDADGQPIPAFLLVPDGDGPFLGRGGAAPAQRRAPPRQERGGRPPGRSGSSGASARGSSRAARSLAPDARHFEDRRTGVTGTEPHRNDWLQHYNGLAHALVRGDTLARAVLDDCLRAVSVLSQVRSASLRHPRRRRPLLRRQLCAVPRRARPGSAGARRAAPPAPTATSSPTARASQALVIPGIADLLDIDDVVGLPSPRPTLLVSAERDPYSADAPAIVARCEARGFGRLRHLRYPGGHASTRSAPTTSSPGSPPLLQLGA